jgi:hypothetical protein
MSALSSRPRSLSGVPLAGDRLVRFLYLDEAGTSAQEPVALVAGVVVHADQQWRVLERHISGLVAEVVPEDSRGGFAFHATELFSGGRTFPRGLWPAEQRWGLLDRLVSIPSTFGVPLVVGFFRKDAIGTNPGAARIPDAMAHALAYAFCAIGADLFMRHHAPDEVATVVAEDAPNARRALKEVQAMLQDETKTRDLPDFMRDDLPITHIKDTVHFAAKPEAIMLQLADACAFTLRHHLARGREADRFLAKLFGGRKIPLSLGDMLAAPGGQVYFTWRAP